MPNHSLKRLGMWRNVLRVDSRHDHAGVGDLGGVAAVTAYNAHDLGTDGLCMLQGHYEIGADVLFKIAATDRENENRILGEQFADLQPFHEDRGPALVISARRQLRYVISRRVAFDADDLAEIIHGMGAVAGAPADAEKEDSSAVGLYRRKQIGHPFDRPQIHLPDDLGRFTHVLLSVTHYSPPPLK